MLAQHPLGIKGWADESAHPDDLGASRMLLAGTPRTDMDAGPRSCIRTVPHSKPSCQDRHMTSVVVWCGVDSRGPASLYIATDSRISWGSSSPTWDYGRKTFSCIQAPFVFGYWGQVLFPALTLPLVQERVNVGMYSGMSNTEAHKAIASTLRREWRGYPAIRRSDVGILIGSREGAGMQCQFLLSILTYSAAKDDWALRSISMPDRSASLAVAGSGSQEVRAALDLWNQSPAANTSRAVFSGFCEALAGGRDVLSGGPPQLVGLRRLGPGRSFGIVVNNQRYLSGADVYSDEHAHLVDVDWFNERFERVNPDTRKRQAGAQVHVGR